MEITFTIKKYTPPPKYQKIFEDEAAKRLAYLEKLRAGEIPPSPDHVERIAYLSSLRQKERN